MTEPTLSDFGAEVIRPERFNRIGGDTPGPPGLKGAGGGGTFDDMEARVGILENEVKHIREDIGVLRADVRQTTTDINAIRVSVATVTENIRHLPTTGKMIGIASVVLGIVATLIGLAPKIQAFLGTAPH